MSNLLKISNVVETAADLYVYGDIVDEKWWDSDVSAQDVKDAVENLAAGSTLNIYVNSGGGSVFTASAMVSMLQRAKDKGVRVKAYVDGLAASAASFLIMAADEITMYQNSMLMIHKPLCALYGNSNDLRAMAEKLDYVQEAVMMPLYNEKLLGSEEHLRELIDAETWLNAAEAAELFNINISNQAAQVAASVKEYGYKNVPECLVKTAEPVAEPTPVEPEPIDYSEFLKVIENVKGIK